LPRRQEVGAAGIIDLLISSDLGFGEATAKDFATCCNLSPDNLKDTWTC
jgi:hypothetical protein